MSDSTKIVFEAIGTSWQIDFFEDITEPKLIALKKKILAAAFKFDSVFSRFKPDSWVTQVYKNPGTFQLPPHAYQLLRLYRKLYDHTGGMFTPCIGQTLADAGYDAEYSLISKKLANPPKFSGVNFDNETLTTAEPVLLDFGAAGKGYLIDILTKLITKSGVVDFWVDGSGDIRNHSTKIIRIGLENPINTKQVIGVAKLEKYQSLCASAGNRRGWNDFHHIINPQSLTSPKNILGTWVVAKTCSLADALATAIFLVPPKKLLENFNFEYCLLTENFQLQNSANFPLEKFKFV